MAAKPSLGTPPANLPALVPSGDHAGNPPLLLKKLVALIGTNDKCHLRLMSSTVSKHHALLITSSDGVYIRDLVSRTKVRVNDRAVNEAWLKDEDQVGIGKFLFQFVSALPHPPSPAAAPQANMIVGGKTSPQPIGSLVVVIGRQNGCDIKLRDEAVSSRHAVIFEAVGKRYIRDLNSRTGTYVNGNKVHLEEIKFGDEIRIGETKLALKPVQSIQATTDALVVELESMPIDLESLPIESEPLALTSESAPVGSEPPAAESELPPVNSRLQPAEPEPQSPEPQEPIPLAPPDEPLSLAPEPPAEPPPPTPVRPRISIAPGIELIPLQPPPGSVLQLRPPAPPPPPQAAPPPPAEPTIAQAPPAPSIQLRPAAPPTRPPAEPAAAQPPVVPVEHRAPAPSAPATVMPVIAPTPPAVPIELGAPTRPASPPAKPVIEPPPPALPIELGAPTPPAPPPARPVMAPTPTAAPIEFRAPTPPVPPSPKPVSALTPPPARVELRAPTSAVPPPAKPVIAPTPPPAPVELRAPTPAVPPPAKPVIAPTPPAAPIELRTPTPPAPPSAERVAAQSPPAQPIKVPAVTPAAPPPAEPRQTTAIQLRGMPAAAAPAPAVPDESAERRSWTDRANIRRIPPHPVQAQAQRAAPPGPADISAESDAEAQAHPEDQEPVIDHSAQMSSGNSVSATIDEHSASVASEPPLIATGLNLDADREPASSNDLLFVEEDFAHALVLPPEMFEEQPPAEASEQPIAGLQVRAEDFADAGPPVTRTTPSSAPSKESIAPSPKTVETPIAGLQVRPEDFADARPPVNRSTPSSAPPKDSIAPTSPTAEKPIAGLQVRPEDFADARPPVTRSAPSSTLPKDVTAPTSPTVEKPIAGLQVRPEDFADARPPVNRSTPSSAPPEDVIAPSSPTVQTPIVETPIVGLQIRAEDFSEVRQPPVAAATDGARVSPAASAEVPRPHHPALTATSPPLPHWTVDEQHDSEVLDLDEPSQPTLDLDLALPSLPFEEVPASVEVEPDDIAFAAIVENFSGDAAGPLIEESPFDAHSESVSVMPPMEPIATSAMAAVAPSNGPSEPSAVQSAAPIDQPHDVPAYSTSGSATAGTAATSSEPDETPVIESAEPWIDQPHDVSAQSTAVSPTAADLSATVDAPWAAPSSEPPAVDSSEPGIGPPHEDLAQPAIVEPEAAAPLSEPLAIESAPWPVDSAQEVGPESTHVSPTADISLTADAASVTAPSDPTEPTVAPPAAPSSPRDVPQNAIGGTGNFPPFIANLDHFLGGMPMQLPNLPAPPSASRRLEVSFGDRPPPSAPQPEPASPALDAGPELIQTPPPPKAVSPKAQSPKRVPFASGFNISGDQVAASPDSSKTDPAADKAEMDRLTSIFEGLAMSPIREKDVFSDFEATAMNDAAFGGARLSRADDYVLPESPENVSRLSSGATEDFAEDEFWERTDEQEGVPPMGVPKPEDFSDKDASASGDVAATTEAKVDAPIEIPLEVAAASGAENIPAQDLSHDRPPPRPPAGHSPPGPAHPPERTRSRRRRLIPFLMLAMLLSMAAAYAAIWFGVPPRSHVYGSLSFLNYEWIPATGDGIEFESAQRRLVADDQTRNHAIELLQQQNPQTSPGFLQIPNLYGRVIRSIGLSQTRVNGTPQTQVKLSYDGADEAGDRSRIGALLQAMIDGNAQKLDSGRRLHEDAERARRAADDAAAQLEQTKAQMAGLQRTVDQAPSAQRVNEIAGRQSDLERARFAAEDAVDADRAALSRLQAAAVAADARGLAGSSTRPTSAADDPQLRQMRQQMVDLNARLQAAKRAQTVGVSQARDQLEDAVKQFNDELTSAGGVLENSSVLKQFVNSAKDSQSKAHELITMLMVDGEDLEKQLEDTRREAEDLIQTRQQEIWSADPRLQDLQAKRDSAQHRYNANVGEGVNDPVILEPLQKEIAALAEQIKARQSALGVDPSEVKLAKGLTRVIESLRNRLQKEKQQIDQVLDPLEKQLKDMDPTVAALPDAQRALAQQISQRLATLNEARRVYADAVGGSAAAPSTVETDLQKQIDDLKTRFDERQANLAEQIQKSVGDERAQQLADAQQKLESDKKALDAAKIAYNAARVDFDNQSARHADADAAMGSIQLAKDQLVQQNRALDQLRRQRDETQARADRSFDIKPFAESDVTSTSTDSRRDYCIYAIVGLAVMFTFLVLAASQPASAEAPAASRFIAVAGDEAKPPEAEQAPHDPDDDAEMLTA